MGCSTPTPTGEGAPIPARALDLAMESAKNDWGVSTDPARLSGELGPMGLHPEGPSLERREALNRLAWELTKLAREVGMTAEDAQRTPPEPDRGLTWWEEVREEILSELYDALLQEVSYTDHGHSDVLISIPFFLPLAIKWRRFLCPDRAWGPVSMF